MSGESGAPYQEWNDRSASRDRGAGQSPPPSGPQESSSPGLGSIGADATHQHPMGGTFGGAADSWAGGAWRSSDAGLSGTPRHARPSVTPPTPPPDPGSTAGAAPPGPPFTPQPPPWLVPPGPMVRPDVPLPHTPGITPPLTASSEAGHMRWLGAPANGPWHASGGYPQAFRGVPPVPHEAAPYTSSTASPWGPSADVRESWMRRAVHWMGRLLRRSGRQA